MGRRVAQVTYRQTGSKRKPREASSWYAHRVRAELALGHPLPKAAHVHHVDGSKSDTAPLVICQDAAYHRALHMRMRVQKAGGNPWSDRVCGRCGFVGSPAVFAQPKQVWCRPCAAAYAREWRAR